MFLDGWSTWVELHRSPTDAAAVSVSVWFAPRAVAHGGASGFTALVDATLPESGFALGHDRVGRIAAVVGGRLLVGTRRLELGVWNHLALSIDGGRAELRLDGAPAGAFDVPLGDLRVPGRILLGRSRDSDLLEGLFPLAAATGLLGPVRVLPTAEPTAGPSAGIGAAADTAPDRARYAADPHRPIAHVSAPQGG